MHRFLLFSLIFFLIGCYGRKNNAITIAGSTSVQPFMEKLAEQFMEKRPDVRIDIQGGGSTAGIQATLNNTCNVGMSSRHLKDCEKDLQTIPISFDGIVIIVNIDNKITDLTEEQIRGIFVGVITNWKEVGGKDSEIIPVTREEGSGTRSAFEELIMEKTAISDACLVQDSNGAVREIIATTDEGIGYISAGLVDERVKALSINEIYPSIENFLSSKYKFIRPFLVLTKETPGGTVKEFIDFILSPEAQNTLAKYGLIPIKGIKVQ